MNLSSIQFIHLVLILIFFSGCVKQDDPDVYEDVEGVVLFENGEPVTDAEIHIKNYFDPDGFITQTEDEYTIEITFESPNELMYTGHLYRYQADTILATFLEDTLEQGEQTVSIPDSLLSNGVYAYHIFNEFNQGFSNLLILNKPDSLLASTLPFTRTNTSGDFTLNSNMLAIENEFTSTATNERFQITDSLQIIVVDNGEIRAKKHVRLEPNEENFFEIILD